MPKFTDNEKAIIQDKLYTEGERLFSQHGIKKVTVDDLVKAAGIAKGSFYAFYENKEGLYFDILGRLQQRLRDEMEAFLSEHQTMPPLELMKKCFIWMLSRLGQYPILKQTDGETIEYLYRKLPPELIEAHTKDDSYELERLQAYGVHFKCGVELATKVMQALAVSFLSMQKDGFDENSAVMDIMLDGVLKEIVGGRND